MLNEWTITEQDMRTRFSGERDLILYEPYQVGDRVVRCGHCCAVIKTTYVTNTCPLCGDAPFRPVPVVPVRPVEVSDEGHRKRSTFMWLLILSVAMSLVPLFFIESDFLYRASFNNEIEVSLLTVAGISIITALLLYNCSETQKIWKNAEYGCVLPLLPVVAPYLIVAAIWAVIFAVAFIIVCAVLTIVLISSSNE